MDGELRTVRSAKSWQKLAAVRIHEIRVRWKLTSDRSFSQRLCVDARTVAKLNRFNPDASLKYNTVMAIFRTLLYLIPTNPWGNSRQDEEEKLIKRAMLEVINEESPMPQGVTDQLLGLIDDAQR